MNDPQDPNAQTGQGGQANTGEQPDPNQQWQGQQQGFTPPPQQAYQPPAQQGFTPPPGQPIPGTPAPGMPPVGQPPANNLSGIMDENVDVSNLVANAGQNQQDSAFLFQMPIAPHPNTVFEERKFVELLAGSISLTINEKRKIIEAIPQLSQFQIDELIKIFEEEKGKFAELEQKHADQIAELEKQHAGSPQDLQAQQEEMAQKAEEEDETERIKRELGLGAAPASAGGGATFQLQFVINNQVYGQAEVSVDITPEEAIAQAKSDPNVVQILQGRQILQEEYIPGQKVNIIVQV